MDARLQETHAKYATRRKAQTSTFTPAGRWIAVVMRAGLRGRRYRGLRFVRLNPAEIPK